MKKKMHICAFCILLIALMISWRIPSFAGTKDGVKTVMKMAEENRRNGEGIGAEDTEKQGEELSEEERWFIEWDAKQQRYPLLEEIEEGGGGDYILLLSPSDEVYRIKEGDTLWGIAKRYYHKGEKWYALKQQNPEITGDGSLIFPDMELTIPRLHYIKEQERSQGYFSSAACAYDVPADWRFGHPTWEVCLEYSYWPEYADVGVYTHVTENRMLLEGIGDGWEEMQRRIADSARKAKGVGIHELEFSRYRKEDGTDLLYYSFVCKAGADSVQCAVAYIFGEKYLIEFIGYCPLTENEETASYNIEEITRYMAASYVEIGGEKIWNSLKYRPYLGYEDWPYEDLHNPFAIMAKKYGPEADEIFKGEDGTVEFVSKEWENLLRKKIIFHYQLTDEQIEEFAERPIYASELAWITEVTLTESPIPGRDEVSVNRIRTADASCADYNLTTLRDLAALPNLQKLTLEIGSADDYEALKECPSLKEVSTASARPITELEWLLELKQLESLTLNISMFPHLNEIGYRKEGATTFENAAETEETGNEEPDGKEGISMKIEDVLAQCTSLKYLRLESTDELDFKFLKELPDLYTFYLEGEEAESEAARARQARFEEKDYSQIKCLVVDGLWLRNPE